MKEKWKWIGALLATVVICACICYLGRQKPETEAARQEVAVQKGGSTDSEEEKTEEQGGTELQLKNNDETGGMITKEENLTEVEDWASTEESYAIENKSDKGKVPKLCGISADKIYCSYTVSDHEKDDITLIYCMYDRNSKATEKLYEHKIRDIVFPAICYNDHMYILDVDMPNYQICQKKPKMS